MEFLFLLFGLICLLMTGISIAFEWGDAHITFSILGGCFLGIFAGRFWCRLNKFTDSEDDTNGK